MKCIHRWNCFSYAFHIQYRFLFAIFPYQQSGKEWEQRVPCECIFFNSPSPPPIKMAAAHFTTIPCEPNTAKRHIESVRQSVWHGRSVWPRATSVDRLRIRLIIWLRFNSLVFLLLTITDLEIINFEPVTSC